MALKLEDKKAIVEDVAQIAGGALSAAAADYSGLSVGQMNALRLDARNSGVYLRVVRNTLARRALAGTEFECMVEALTGPLVLAFSQEDPGAAARLFKNFSKDNKALEVRHLALSGQLLGADQLDRVAKLPTYDQAIAMLMSVMKAPITKLVRTMAEPTAKMVRTFAALKDVK